VLVLACALVCCGASYVPALLSPLAFTSLLSFTSLLVLPSTPSLPTPFRLALALTALALRDLTSLSLSLSLSLVLPVSAFVGARDFVALRSVRTTTSTRSRSTSPTRFHRVCTRYECLLRVTARLHARPLNRDR
jgi:hypothetical protein